MIEAALQRRSRVSKERRIAIVLGLVAVIAIGGAATGAYLGLAPQWCGEREITAGGADGPAITFVGDTLLGDAASGRLARDGYEWPFALLPELDPDDVVVANAEGPITTRSEPFDPGQRWNYNAQPDAAVAMKRAGIDVLSLANNHAMDRGTEGVTDTIAAATDAGLATVGAGSSLCEAELPLLVRHPAGTVAIVSLGKDYGPRRTATPAHAGTVALTPAAIVRGATLARAAGARWIVAVVHWGFTYEGTRWEQRVLAEEFARAGYDLVVGTHPHVTQEVDAVEGMPVLYSIGNYVFGAPGRFTGDWPGVGLVARARFDTDGLVSLSLRCIVTDNKVVAYQPRPCDASLAARVFGSLGDDLTVVGETAEFILGPGD